MSTRLHPLLHAALVAALLGAAPAAFAATEGPFTDAFPDTFPPDPNPGGQTDWSETLEVPQFDPSLGTLTEVRVSYEATMLSSGTIMSEQPASQTYEITLDGDIEIGMPGTLANVTEMIADSDGGNLAGGEALDVEIEVDRSGNQSTTDAGDLATFTGNGTVSFPASAEAFSGTLASGNVDSTLRTFAGVAISVEYEFQAPFAECTGASLNENGGSVTIESEFCSSLSYQTAWTCDGDLALTLDSVGSLPASCSVGSSSDDGFTVTCTGNGSGTTQFAASLAGANGSCSSNVTNLLCGGVDQGAQSCSGSFSKRPPPPPVPGISFLGLLAALLALPMIGIWSARRRRG